MIDAYLDISHVRGNSWTSAEIGWFGGGILSHVDIVVPAWYCDLHEIPRGSLLGARSDRVGGQPTGVYIRPPNYEQWLKHIILRVPCAPDEALRAWEWVRKQIGSAYDTPGLLRSFVLGRDWREEGSWWCSELAVRMLEVGGIIQELPLPVTKITPGDSALICSAAGGYPVLSVGMQKLAA